MNIVDLFIKFRKIQDNTILTKLNISNEALNCISIELLSWLKLEYKRTLWIQ